MNHTLLEMARSMLIFKNLSPLYWVEEIHTQIYFRNKSPTTYLDAITPYEACLGFKPQVKHLRFLGSVCYALVPKEKWTNIYSRSLKCILIGYYIEKKVYHILSNGNFIVSMDVIFDETESKSATKIESLLQKLESKGDRKKRKMKNQPSTQHWIEIKWPSLEFIQLTCFIWIFWKFIKIFRK